jgi:hypothetical protein
MADFPATPAMVAAHDQISSIRAQIAALKADEKRVIAQVRNAMEFMGTTNVVLDDKSLFMISEVSREKFDAEAFDEAHPMVREPYITRETHERFIVGRVHKGDGDADADPEAAEGLRLADALTSAIHAAKAEAGAA